MLPTLTGSGPAIVRGLYGYETEEIWWEQPHALTYRARRKIDGLRVLVKLLRDPGSFGWGTTWLQRDYQLAQELKASCAVKPLAFEQTDLGPALIYADEGARPLEELASEAPLDVDTLLTIGINLAEAIAALHKERLVHCNVTPTTVWLRGSSVLISDFGWTRRLSEDADQGMPHHELIDVRYMSPEQTGRLQTIIDQRTDIYSLGIILFRLLTGKVPFDGPAPLEIIDGHVARQPTVPLELRDKLPAGLIRVILKGLSKDPESRYLSASGLVADLVECGSIWRSTGALAEFEPGRHDAKAVLRVSRRLYGRDRDRAMLLEKAKAAQGGRSVLLLVKGAAGVGKSALLGELEKFVCQQNGIFVSGKFDQYKSEVPYSALLEALRQLIGQILSESNEQLETWRSRILAGVGNNAQVVIDLIPELESITGPQPAVPALPPVQARNRFNRVFAKLVQAFAPRDRLLCIVLDDLQWAEASLELMSHVLTDPETRNVVLAGAYRDDEVGPDHPLETAIRELRQSYVDVEILHLNELGEPDVLQLVRDTFAATTAEARPLSRVLYRKTSGDPLYLTQLLHFLCDRDLIAFDYPSGKWTWDLSRIQREGLTDDILDMLNRRLEGLHQDMRSILSTAACIGSSFEIGKVAVAAGRSLPEVRRCMATAVEEGLIVPPEDLRIFRFVHDRIQQAAFDCIPSDTKKRFRLQIGRRLLAALTAEDELVPQPDVLSSLNYGWELITDEEERLKIARLNLVAGTRARQALAYRDALGYISVALSLLGENAWQRCYSLAFDLQSEALECEYLRANFEGADRLFKSLIANARSKLDKARTYRTKIILDTTEERYEHAIHIAIEALKLFDIRYLRKPSRFHLLIELFQVRFRMRGRKPKDLLHAKALEDAEKIAALRILLALGPPAYFVSPDLLMFTALKVVNYSLRHGISPLSAGGFVLYGMCLGSAMDAYDQGYDFGSFALDLAERGNDPAIYCRVLYIYAAMIKPWRDPIDETFPLFDRVRRIGLEVGEHQYVNYAIGSSILPRITRGTSLYEALRVYDEQSPFVLRSRDVLPVELVTMYKNCALALQGKTKAPYSLSEGAYDETEAELHYRRTGNLTLVFFQYLIRLHLAFLFGRYEEALSLSDKGDAVVRSASGFTQLADHYLYRGLAAAVALGKGDARRRKTLRHCLDRLHVFAVNCPQNFLQHEVLLQAETARAQGLNDALHYYNRAIQLAEAEGFTHLVGLANERAALCCLAHEHRALAGWYLACSRSAYDKWGAAAKVAWLDSEYATLLPAPNVSTETTHVDSHGEHFDIAAALRAAHIIASGKDPEAVLRHLMQVIRVQAGAETAQLLALEGGQLRLEASAAATEGEVALFPSSAADMSLRSFSPAVVNHVLHTGEDLMLVEADADSRFARCPYIASRHPKSVICSGIHHQGELLGVIYLEHNQITGAFSGPKLEWLRLLSTHVGLTVWNGRLSRYRDYVRKFAPISVSTEIDANPISPDLAAKDCDVSILFADLAGYTRLSEMMGRRQLTELINRAFSRFTDEIHRYDGVLLEVSGDELFVLFGDEDPSKHVRKAAKAALAIAHAATALKEELSSGYPPLIMNMGINSGVASVGLHSVEASSGARWRYGASGPVVNIAARVRELARDGEILITADSVARVPNDFVFKDIGERSLKNVAKAIRIFRLIDELNDLETSAAETPYLPTTARLE
jgi:predicted ATPase/class 3 adenylate cyclase